MAKSVGSKPNLRILLVDDHAIVRSGLRRLLMTMLPKAEVIEAATGLEALVLAQAERPALIILDFSMPGLSGFELLRRILAKYPESRIIVLSMYTETIYAAKALRLGAVGYLSKNVSPEELLKAIHRVADGGSYIEAEIAQALATQTAKDSEPMVRLTTRDLEIIRLLGDGQTLSTIATSLGITYKTVANTSSQLKAKLGITRTADLVRLAIEKQLP